MISQIETSLYILPESSLMKDLGDWSIWKKHINFKKHRFKDSCQSLLGIWSDTGCNAKMGVTTLVMREWSIGSLPANRITK